ncbi:hypothetical protein [Olsenella sp. An290]|uniref:hypothetical protein n=1 Tax=Olsenella sp. An290 TaxID=1965625 RepID=UPI000B370578|nr:hypothetical protein [Olsenella sp. An290]OUO33992.1 hypothetical protein B5F84_08245 [Olsenella sp. An290]
MPVEPLMAVCVLAPVAAFVLERVGSARISERHHSHHDTYVVPATYTRALVLMIAFMGFMGVVLGGFSLQGVLSASAPAVLGFFGGFVLTSFVLWWVTCRYKVSTFDDRMEVTPFVGAPITVRYEDIERMEWCGLRKGSGYRDLAVWVGGRRVVRLNGIVDVEQIIMCIDRFDALPPV